MNLKSLFCNNIDIISDNINIIKDNLNNKNFNKFNVEKLMKKPESSNVKGAIFGVAVGDALGVPFEFKNSEEIKISEVRKMEGGGRWGQVGGTWSDDSSMTFCTMESLCKGYNCKDIGYTFYKWLYKSYWTPYGIVFDVGMTTSKALRQIRHGNYNGCGELTECGNGALMRIMPIVFLVDKNKDDRFSIIREVASLTHSHIRSVIGCAIYVEFALNLLNNQDIKSAYRNMQKAIIEQYEKDYKDELLVYKNIVYDDIAEINPKRLNGKGYVVSSLECSMYSFITSTSYSDCVLKAISFGEDTDTVAAIAGGLAGLYWGYDNIPSKWINKLARKDDITNLCERFEKAVIE